MWQPIQTHPLLEVIFLDSKSFCSSECLPRKSSRETKLQFAFKIFHVFCFSYGREFLVFSKNFVKSCMFYSPWADAWFRTISIKNTGISCISWSISSDEGDVIVSLGYSWWFQYIFFSVDPNGRKTSRLLVKVQGCFLCAVYADGYLSSPLKSLCWNMLLRTVNKITLKISNCIHIKLVF